MLTIPEDREVLTVHLDDNDRLFTERFGPVHDWKHKEQVAHCVSGSGRDLCIHRLHPLQNCQLFGLEWVRQLCWQTLVLPSIPIMASRDHDVVSLAFDRIGPVRHCDNHPKGSPPEHRWLYRLYRFRWWDEDEPSDRALLGVWPD